MWKRARKDWWISGLPPTFGYPVEIPAHSSGLLEKFVWRHFSLPFEGHYLGRSFADLRLLDWFLTSSQHCLLSGQYIFHFVSLGLFAVKLNDKVF